MVITKTKFIKKEKKVMKITTEVYSKSDFDFWSGAVDTVNALTDDEFEEVIQMLDISYPDGMTATELNDLFWFDEDFVAECLGFDSWEEFEASKEED